MYKRAVNNAQTETFNPQMLTLARESRGMNQTKLARALSVSQAKLSKIESGLMDIDDDLLARIAEVLEYPQDFFTQPTPRHSFSSNCLYHRKRQSASVSDLRRIIAQLKICRLEIEALLRSVEIEADNRFHRMDLVEYGNSPESIAQVIRRSWSLPPGPIDNLTRAIESAGGIVVHCTFGAKTIDAMSQWAPGMPPVIFANREVPGDRLRYSLAHEIGHIIMHQIPTEDMEREANRFAGEFLMPKSDIAAYLSNLSIPKLASLKEYWKVSMAALLQRAHSLNKLTPPKRDYLWKKMAFLGYKTREPVEISLEEPAIITAMVKAHIDELGYSVADLSRIVRSQESHFRARYLQESQRHLRIVAQ